MACALLEISLFILFLTIVLLIEIYFDLYIDVNKSSLQREHRCYYENRTIICE